MKTIDKILNDGPFVWLEDELRPRFPGWLFYGAMASLALLMPWGIVALIALLAT